MMITVVETIFGTNPAEDQKRYYSFPLPVPQHSSYRQALSFNAFFYRVRSPKNWTENRLFIARRPDEMTELDQAEIHDPLACADIFAFYRVIGYDPKRRRYVTGERIRKSTLG